MRGRGSVGDAQGGAVEHHHGHGDGVGDGALCYAQAVFVGVGGQHDAAGAVLAEGRERVADMNYLLHSARAPYEADVLPYEKRMVEDWVERRFCRGRR